LLTSAEVNYNYDVAFSSPTTDPFPVDDDHGGFSKFEYLEGKKAFQTYYGDENIPWHWRLSLVRND